MKPTIDIPDELIFEGMQVGKVRNLDKLVIHSLEHLIEVAKLPGQEIDLEGVDFGRDHFIDPTL
jgi:hypothetical protein